MSERAPSTRDVYDRCASRYHERFKSYAPYREKVLELARDLPRGSSVVDLGCGSGVNARRLVDAGLRVTGYDNSEAMLRIARRECPEGAFRLVDLRELPDAPPFDAVLASFCIVHFDDDEALAFLGDIPKLMRPGAALSLSFMEGREPGSTATSFSEEPLFYNYFDRSWVRSVLSSVGLELVSESTHDYPEPDGSTTTDVFLRFRAGETAPAGRA